MMATEQLSELGESALRHLKWGRSVFPVGPDKKPLVRWGAYQTEKPTESDVRAWWTQWPAANIGMACGPVSGFVVLDIDNEEGLQALHQRGVSLPETLTVRTGRGWHYYFQDPGVKTKNFARGKREFPIPYVDFRGHGGYVIVPLSRHANGQMYRVEKKRPAVALPDWLLTLVRDPDPVQHETAERPAHNGNRLSLAEKIFEKAVAQSSEGTRNEMGLWLACQLRDNGLTETEADSYLRRYATAVRDHGSHPYLESEARESLQSAYSRPAREGWTSPGSQTTGAASTEAVEESGLVDALGAFPEEAWRGPFKVYRDAMQGTSEAPDTAHFSSLWALAAACLRRRVNFYYAYPHFANVYLVNFGNTGDSKTSAGRQGLRLLPDEGVKLLRGVGSAEALGDWMQQPEEGPAVSHLLFIEELATLLTRGGWEGSTLLSFLTETFDAPQKYEIPFRKNPVLVQEPTPTLIAGTTIEWLWKGLREIDVHGGFGNRIFYMTGTPKPPIPLPAKPNPDALADVRVHLHRLTNLSPRELFFTPDAQALWNDFYRAWKSTTWPELTTAAIKRVPAYIVKLSMIYACFEGTSLITADQLSAAIKVGHYGAKCADQLMNRHRQHTVQGKCETRVLAVLKDEELPAWQVHRRISGSYTAEELGRAIRALVTAGVILQVGTTRRNEPMYGRRDRKREV